MNILNKICEDKLIEINKLKKKFDYHKKIQDIGRKGFLDKLVKFDEFKYNLIAEIKKSSPSKGEICKNFDPVNIAEDYEDAGASCLSILTEQNFFKGKLSHISEVRKRVKIPILRKDFILDEWQIYESYYFGADCILLILAIIDDKKASRYYNIAKELKLDVIVEVHDLNELNRALKLNVECIGINNRNLKTLEIDLNTFSNLSKKIPENIIKICESGISKNYQLKKLTENGADAFLVGEYLMSSDKIKDKTRELIKK